MLPVLSNGAEGARPEKKVWEGGFYEKIVPPSKVDNAPASPSSQRTVYHSARTDSCNTHQGDHEDDEDAPSSSSRRTVYFSASTSSPLRLSIHSVDLSAKLNDCDVDGTPIIQEDGGSSSDLDADSDKENVDPPPALTFGRSLSEGLSSMDGPSFVVGLEDVDRESMEDETDDEEGEYGNDIRTDEDEGECSILSFSRSPSSH